MIDIGWPELLMIAVVMIVVVGPKDLPAVLKGIGQVTRRIRGMADEFKKGVDEFIRESELNELKDGVQQVRNFDLNKLKSETERQFKDMAGQTIDPNSPTAGTKDSSAAKSKSGGAASAEKPSSEASAASGSKPSEPAPPEKKDA